MKNKDKVRFSDAGGDAVCFGAGSGSGFDSNFDSSSGSDFGSGLADDRFKLHGIYRHFKGGLYILEDIIYNSETNEKMVTYRALYGDGRLWCRPYEMFFEEVDREKYPDAGQKYRFELLEMGVGK